MKADDNTATLEMSIQPWLEERLKQFPYFLELEMLQGERKPMPYGFIYYKIEITDMYKIFIVREFVLKCISESSQPIIKN